TSPGAGVAWIAATVNGRVGMLIGPSCPGRGAGGRAGGRVKVTFQTVRTDCTHPPDLSRSISATGEPGPARRAPVGDPRPRPGLLRPVRIRGCHGTAPGDRDRAVPGRDLPPLPGQGVALPRRRAG